MRVVLIIESRQMTQCSEEDLGFSLTSATRQLNPEFLTVSGLATTCPPVTSSQEFKLTHSLLSRSERRERRREREKQRERVRETERERERGRERKKERVRETDREREREKERMR